MSYDIEIKEFYKSIQAAASRIQNHAVETPVRTSEALNKLTNARLYFKCENLQRTGAFKFRGALNALLQLDASQRQQGVYTVSSGNHGAALACAGQLLDIKVTVAVPSNAPSVKRRNIESYAADIVTIEPGMAAREAFVASQQDSGQCFIPPYDHPHIIQGQGTAALELIQQVDQEHHETLDVVLTPLGGGGLLSGSCITAKANHVTTVYGAEPELADDAYQSLQQGVIQPAKPPQSICDGLLTSLGQHTFAILRKHLTEVLRVDDAQTLAAQQLLHEHLQLWVEPSAAITLAAIRAYPAYFENQRVGVILSGGNVAPASC